uniref:guanylate cyclase n=3 Tax=Meloidogyne TaxID=189290 RepID=A0A915LYP7_MELJA
IALVTNSGPIAYERVAAFEEEFRRTNTVIFDENWDSNEIIKSGLLNEISQNARNLKSFPRLDLEQFMISDQLRVRTCILGALIALVLRVNSRLFLDASPWMGSTGEVLQQVKDTYANAVIVDDVNGFDNVLVDTFVSRIEKFGLAKEDLDLTNTFAYLHLYDSLKLYALAVRKVMNKTDEANQTAAVLDGHQIWSAMRRLSFDGIGTVVSGSNTGLVQMDDLADRAPQFAAFFIAPNREKVLKMVQMTTYRIPNCDGTINRTGCYDLKLTDVMTGFWPSENGAMPPDEPVCGFRGQRCSYTVEIAVGATVLALIMLILLLWLLRRHCQTRALNKMPWRLFSDDFRLIDEEAARSLLSIGSSNTKLSNQSIGGSKKHAILGVNTHATYRRFIQKQPLKFNREDMVLLTAVKDAIHDNINPFLGMAFNDKEEMFILWKFCSRGSVQDIIYNKSMTLDEKFHAAFVRDITLGLEYLHLSKVGFHGLLSPSTCVIDRNWSVRLTDFGLATMLERWQKEGQIQPYKAEEEEEVVKEKRRGSKEKSCPTAFDRRGLKANCLLFFN